MKYVTTFSTTAASTQTQTSYVVTIVRPNKEDSWKASYLIYGTFAGATATLQFAPGTTATLINIKDINGTTAAHSANGYGNLTFGGDANRDNSTDQIHVYLSVGTSTDAISLTAEIYDNR